MADRDIVAVARMANRRKQKFLVSLDMDIVSDPEQFHKIVTATMAAAWPEAKVIVLLVWDRSAA